MSAADGERIFKRLQGLKPIIARQLSLRQSSGQAGMAVPLEEFHTGQIGLEVTLSAWVCMDHTVPCPGLVELG